jgi:polar amino acid transport system substrate-binding protein
LQSSESEIKPVFFYPLDTHVQLMLPSARYTVYILAAVIVGACVLVAGCVSEPFSHAVPAAPAGEELTFYTEQFPPYNYEENGTLKGLSVDLLEEISVKTGMTMTRGQIHLVPWTEGYQAALSRNNTVLFSTGRIPERENFFKWAGPIHTYSTVLFARPDRHITITKPEDLKGYRIGVIRDAVGVKQLIGKGVNESQLVTETNASILIAKLAGNEIDLWAYPEPTGRYLTRQQTGDPYAFEVVYTLPSLELWYAFNRNVPDLTVQSFQQALDELRTGKDAAGNTTYERITARYIL